MVAVFPQIIMVPGTSDRPSDGLERHVCEISKRLALKGFEVTNLKPSINGLYRISSIEDAYKLVEIPVALRESNFPMVRLNKSFRTALYFGAYKEAVTRFMRTVDAPLITHTHGFLVFSQPRKSSRSKRLATFHGIVPLDLISKGQSITKAILLTNALKQIYKKNTDKFTAISPRIRLLAAKCYDIDPRDITVTPHGVDCSFFSKLTCAQEIDDLNKKFALDKPYKILFVGQLDRNKRFDVLLKALTLLKDKKNDIQLVLRSHWGDYYEETLRLIKYLGVQDMVKFIRQPVYGSELRALYHTSNVFINTFSNLTGYSTALLEAMASGVPSIISKGSNEDVVDESSGIILNDLTPESMANSIRLLVDDKKYANKLSQNAKNKMYTNFDWDNVTVPNYISVYNQLLE